MLLSQPSVPCCPRQTGAAGTSEQVGKVFPYLVAQVSEVQGAGGRAVPALYDVAKVGFPPALGLAQVPEVVKEEPPLHEDAAGEDKEEFALAPLCSQQFTIVSVDGSAPKISSSHIQASRCEKSVGNLHEMF